MRTLWLDGRVVQAMEVLEAAGLRPLVAGGVFHPPAGDVDVYVPEWPDRRVVGEVARALGAPRVREKGLCLEFRAEPLPVQVVPVPFRDPLEVLEGFDLGAAQVGLYRGELVETEAHRRAVREWRPNLVCVGPATPARVLKYRDKGFLSWEEDFVDAVLSLLLGLAEMDEEARAEFFMTYDGVSLRLEGWARALGPALMVAGLAGLSGVRRVPVRFHRVAPRKGV